MNVYQNKHVGRLHHHTLRRRAFTLVELITVVAILGILMAFVVPGASAIWAQRNEAATTNLIRGLLQSARSQAIRTGERGLIFFVDDNGVQNIAFIEADPPDYTQDGTDACDCDDDCWEDTDWVPTDLCVNELLAGNRFRVSKEQVYLIPSPHRAVPLWALDEPSNKNPKTPKDWPDQLANSSFPDDADGKDSPRYHRNFFTVLFNAAGEVVVNRDILIHDPDDDENGYGDTLGLPVADELEKWWTVDYEEQIQKADSLKTSVSGDKNLFDLVVVDDDVAANFRSVEGIMVYDDSDIAGLDGEDIRQFLLDEGTPFYINRYTGDVTEGPKEKG